MSGSTVWDAVLSNVETRGNRFTLSTWFKPINLISDKGTELQVCVPNALFRDWFLKHYAATLEEILVEVGRGDTTVSYVTMTGQCRDDGGRA